MNSVSIVIPCRNEEEYIGRCLDSVINNNYQTGTVDIYVCDGLSTDSTVNIVNEYSDKYQNIHLLVNHKLTTPYALNLGIKQSKSEVVIILGAHSEIESDYISNCVSELEADKSLGCVGGIINNIYENNLAMVIGHAMSSGFGVGNAYFRTGGKEGYVDTVAFGAYNRSVFEDVGLFDEELARNQDDEFNFRLIKGGYKIALKKNIRSNYYVRASFKKLYKQYYQYGYWKVFVNKKHNTITSIRQLVPLLFVLFIIFGLLLSFANKLFLYMFLITLILYFSLGLFFSFSKSRSIIKMSGIVFSFFILHFSYGMGYLSGIFRFIFMGKKPASKQESLSR